MQPVSTNQFPKQQRSGVIIILTLSMLCLLLLGHQLLATAAPEAPVVSGQPRAQETEALRLLYIASSEDNATVTATWLEDRGFSVDVITSANLEEHSIFLPVALGSSVLRDAPNASGQTAGFMRDNLPELHNYDLVIIGADTGEGENWLSDSRILITVLAESGLPIVGLGNGGHAFFGKLGLEIGHPNGTGVRTTAVRAIDFGDTQTIYETPTVIELPPSRELTLYRREQPSIALDLQNPPVAGWRVAGTDREGSVQTVIATADDNRLLWGFDAAPDQMTGDGESLFVNALWFLTNDKVVPLSSGNFTPRRGIDEALLQELQQSNAPLIRGLVQLNALPSPEEQAALEEAGITLLNYVHGTTYRAAIARELDPDAETVRQLVRWAGPIRPVDKVPPKVAAGQFEPWAVNPDGTIKVIVRFHEDVTLEERGELIGEYFPEAIQLSSHAYRMHLTSAQISEIVMEDTVAWLNEGPELAELLNDVARREQYVDEVQDLDLSQNTIFYRGLSGRGVQAGIFDTGVTSDTFSHPDFAGRLLRTEWDAGGHGTHVAGILGGSGADSPSLRLRGMAPEVELVPYNFRTWGIDEMREALSSVPVAPRYEMDVSNHSYTHGCGGYGTENARADELVRGDTVWWSGPGTLQIREPLPPHHYVAGAGNQGTGAQWCTTRLLPPSPPRPARPDPTSGLRGYFSLTASAKNAVVVGALDPASDLRLRSSSSRGPTWDGRLKPDVVANGCMWSTNHVPTATVVTYNWQCGTSMATPAVAGILTLMQQQYQTDNPGGSRPQPALFRAILAHTAIDLVQDPSLDGFDPYRWNDPDSGQPVEYFAGPDWSTGYGAVNADRAVDLLAAEKYRTDTFRPADRQKVYSFFVPAGRTEIRFTLAWDDEPGDTSTATRLSTPELVNDLDLTLEAPDGTVHLPWILSLPPRHSSYVTGNAWRETGAQDPINHARDITPAFQGVNRRDNLEQIQVTDPNGLPPGLWTLRVDAHKLPNVGEQPFVVIGDFTMTLETQPTVRILAPDPGQRFVQSDTIDLVATAEDLEDADENLTIEWWTEDTQGTPYLIGNSAPGQRLTVPASSWPGCGGPAVPLIARVTDSASVTRDAEQLIDLSLNSQAQVYITGPADGDSYVTGQSIVLKGNGTNLRCPESFDAQKLEWHLNSTSGRLLGTGPEVTTTLPRGNHRIYLTYDDNGILVQDAVDITVVESDLEPPITRIINPTDGAVIVDFSTPPFATVELRGAALGPDGFLEDQYIFWSYRVSGTSDWISAGSGQRLSVDFVNQSCTKVTTYDLRLVANNDVLPPGYDYITFSVRAWLC